MRRGCIAVGELKCNECQRTIEYGEPHLVVDENESKQHFCVDCCLKNGEAAYVKEKGEKVLTFFPPKKDV